MVPGTSDAKFRYWIDSKANQQTLAGTGSVTVTVTGKVGNAARTVETQLRSATFLDFLYYTDVERIDPFLAEQAQECSGSNHAFDQPGEPGYDDNDKNTSGCELNYFYGQGSDRDVINGPLHTNDLMRVCGNPLFNGPASTSYPGYEPTESTTVKPGEDLWIGRTDCDNDPEFAANPDTDNLVYSDQILPLPSNSALKTFAGGNTGGCAYEGATSIEFKANGTMDVWSPNTLAANVGANCPLGTDAPVNGPLPSNGVIYVDVFTGGCTSQQGNGVGYPKNGDIKSYDCKSGDVFVEGLLNGQATIGADQDIIVTGDLLYHDKTPGSTSYQGSDILGLIANQFVAVYHPVVQSGTGTDTDTAANHSDANTDPEINAVMLSVDNSFYVQNWQHGAPLGDLTVFGTIAQHFNGPIATYGDLREITSGYIKVYNYDNRLQYLAPPFFLTPTATEYQQSTFKELKPRLS